MSPRKAFDRFMVDNEIGGNAKLGRLTDAEFRAFICGVLPIASKAEVRGAFMVGKLPATAEDIAFVSRKTPVKVAESCIAKMRDLGMLERDDELGGEWVHDFDEYNPAPRNDPTNAKRQAEWRARNGANNGATDASNASRNGDITQTKIEEGIKKTPLTPRDRGAVKFNGKTVPKLLLDTSEQILGDFNEREGTAYQAYGAGGKLTEPHKRIVGALIDRPHIGAETGRRINEMCLAPDRRFWDGPAQPGVVWGPNVVDRNVALVMGAKPKRSEMDDWLGGSA